MHNKDFASRANRTFSDSERIDLNCSAPVGLFGDGDTALYLVTIADGRKAAITLNDPLSRPFILHELADEDPIDDGFSLGPANLRLKSVLENGPLYLEQTGIILLDALQVSLSCQLHDGTLTSLPIGTYTPDQSYAGRCFDSWLLQDATSGEILFTRPPVERFKAPEPDWHRPASISEIYFDLPA